MRKTQIDIPSVLVGAALFFLSMFLYVLSSSHLHAQESSFLDNLDPYISAGVSGSYWPDRSNQDGLEADSDIGLGGRVAGGVYIFDYARVEVEAGYTQEALHGFNIPDRGIERTLDGHDLHVGTLMVGLGGEVPVTDWVSLYGMVYGGAA